MQRLELTAPELDGFGYMPGQDVMLLVAAEGRKPVRRRYTIRRFDAAARPLTLDVVLHGDGPGERWVRAARPGDRIEGIGPRGKVFAVTCGRLASVHGRRGRVAGHARDDRVAARRHRGNPGRRSTRGSRRAGCSPPARTRISWLHRLGRPAGDPCRTGGRGGRGRAAALAMATPICSARPRSCWRCAKNWPPAACRRIRCRLRPTGGAAARTPVTASPPGTPDRQPSHWPPRPGGSGLDH